MAAPRNRNIYVIELDDAVRARRKFVAANPDCRLDKPCLYVGSTGGGTHQRSGLRNTRQASEPHAS